MTDTTRSEPADESGKVHDQLVANAASDECSAGDEQWLAANHSCLLLIEQVRKRYPGSWPLGLRGGAPLEGGPDGLARDESIGRFRLIRELGRGGHGIVFLAHDPTLKRNVALKVPRMEALFSPELRARFLREAEAVGRLTHPNIVPVYEVGQAAAVYYIASAYCAGPTLGEWLFARDDPVSAREAAEIVARLASAVAFAHSQGVLHRDLKPANVLFESPTRCEPMFGDQDQTPSLPLEPKLTDFGLAKLSESIEGVTRTGTILGTPAYMAPEQAEGRSQDIGPAADVYALGAILYELLVRKPPFKGCSDADTIRRLLSDDVLPPRQLRADVPRDLEAICLRCLRHNPGDRYASAAALEADLRRFLSGQTISARPLGMIHRAVRWSCRRPATMAALAIGFLAVVTVALGAVWHQVKLAGALRVAEQARASAEKHEGELQLLVYLRDMQATYNALEKLDVRQASQLLDGHPAATTRRRGFLWRHLAHRCRGRLLHCAAHQGHAHTVDFSPDGALVASAGSDGAVQIVSAASGTVHATLQVAGEASCAAFSPKGTTLAAAEASGRIRLWKVDAGQFTPAQHLSAPLAHINCIAWSADGARLAVAGSPGRLVAVWERTTEDFTTIPCGHADEINRIAFSPDGRLLATASSDETVIVWNLRQNAATGQLQAKQSHVTGVQFSADGRWLATTGVSGAVKIWDAGSWKVAAVCETNSDRVDAFDFLSGGTQIAFADSFGVVRVWNWQEDKLLRALESQQGRILSLSFSAATNKLATAARTGSICIWDLDASEAVRDLPTNVHGSAAAFSQDGSQLIAADTSGGIVLFDTPTCSLRKRLSVAPEPISTLAVAGDELFASWGRGGAVYRWNMSAKKGPEPFAADLGEIDAILSIPSRPLLMISAGRPRALGLWDANSARQLRHFGTYNADARLSATPAGDVIARGNSDGTIHLWNLDEGRLLRTIRAHAAAVRCVAFCGDGETLASSGDDRLVRFWNPNSGAASKAVLHHPFFVGCLAFCPDEPLLATGDDQGYVRLWHWSASQELMTLGRLAGPVTWLSFSPDGQCLVAETRALYEPGQMRAWLAANR